MSNHVNNAHSLQLMNVERANFSESKEYLIKYVTVDSEASTEYLFRNRRDEAITSTVGSKIKKEDFSTNRSPNFRQKLKPIG